MDSWAWSDHLAPWVACRVDLPVGPLFCVIDGPDSREAVVGDGRARGAAPVRRGGWCSAPVRAASASSRSRGRARTRGGAVASHPASAGAFVRVHDQRLPAGDRCRGDHRHDPRAVCTDDARQRWSRALRPSSHSGHTRERERRTALPHRCPLEHGRSVDFRQRDLDMVASPLVLNLASLEPPVRDARSCSDPVVSGGEGGRIADCCIRLSEQNCRVDHAPSVSDLVRSASLRGANSAVRDARIRGESGARLLAASTSR
jgi:hypothetical protein